MSLFIHGLPDIYDVKVNKKNYEKSIFIPGSKIEKLINKYLLIFKPRDKLGKIKKQVALKVAVATLLRSFKTNKQNYE